jgi:hypothetical protein
MTSNRKQPPSSSFLRFYIQREAENRFALNIEGEERPHEFRTLLSALTFTHIIMEDRDISLTVLDSDGEVVDEFIIGPA